MNEWSSTVNKKGADHQMKPKTGEIKFLGLGRIAIKPIKVKKVMKCRQGFLKGLATRLGKQ